MLKTIVLTCLMTFSCSGGSLKINHPRLAQNNTTQINGFYNLRDEMSWPQQYGSFDIVKETDNIECYVYINEMYYKVNTMSYDYSIRLAPYYSMKVTANVYDPITNQNINISETSQNSTGDCEQLDNYNINFKNLILYYPSTFYYTDERTEVFNNFFMKDNNAYIETYNGYFALSLDYTNTDNFDIRGAFMIDNTIYYEMYDEGTNEIWTRYYTYDDNGNKTTADRYIFGSNKAPKNRNIYMNVPKLPNSVKQTMETFGVFDYIQEHVDTTWYEMILSTMDAPIYYLSQLMSFELFGINLFIAFSSLMTLMIIVAVIKKVL